jgi:hypothetical protein
MEAKLPLILTKIFYCKGVVIWFNLMLTRDVIRNILTFFIDFV